MGIPFIKRHPVVLFFILAYGIAWLFWMLRAYFNEGNGLLTWIGGFSPAISAVLVLLITEGRGGVQAILSKLFVWRVPVGWYLVAILTPLVMVLLAVPFQVILGNADLPGMNLQSIIQLIPAIILLLGLIISFGLFMSAGEELGWRGFALPRLQDKLGPLWASVVLGGLWGIWHLPLFFLPGTAQYGLAIPGYVLACMGYSVIYTCLYNHTKGSVLIASLYHAADNSIISFAAPIMPSIVNQLYFSLLALAMVILLVMGISRRGGTWAGFGRLGNNREISPGT